MQSKYHKKNVKYQTYFHPTFLKISFIGLHVLLVGHCQGQPLDSNSRMLTKISIYTQFVIDIFDNLDILEC